MSQDELLYNISIKLRKRGQLFMIKTINKKKQIKHSIHNIISAQQIKQNTKNNVKP